MKLNEVLIKLGFVKSMADDYLYFLQESEKIVLMVLVYMDNIVVTCSHSSKKFASLCLN